MSYVNLNVGKLRNGGRKAPKVTKDFLKEKIWKLLNKYEPDEYDDLSSFNIDETSPYTLMENNKIESDLKKVSFDFENYEFEDDGKDSLCGLHTLDNGFTFLGGWGGGDWEFPVFFIIYWDGKALRGYIPVCGNTYNIDMKVAFGSEGNYGDENLCDKFEKEYDKVYYPKDKDYKKYGMNMTRAYCIYHNYPIVDDETELEFHWKGIEVDIKNRIEII